MMKSVISCLIVAIVVMMAACGDEVVVKKTVYDTSTEVFLEGGKMHAATTQFTDAEMQRCLHDKAWRRAYAFYYDESKVGKRNEIAFAASNYYVFGDEGAAYMGDVDNYRERQDYTYAIEGRNVKMWSPEFSFTLRVVAIDDTLMVTDTPMTGQRISGYDDATVRQRTVFTKIAVPLPPL